ncbi:MAG TPA: hypothetical protein VKR53_06455 [Puia sp.]|nr:hypothetical protein [Puia sp.]
MNYKVFPAGISLVLFASFILSDNTVEHINKALNTFFEKYPQEKVYLQFDKQQYTIGDTVWYKGYVTYKSAPSSISKVLYVEMVNDHGEIVKRQSLPVEEGGAPGDFVLEEGQAAGNYYIRSYTSWMMNFDPSFYFYNKIRIGLDENRDAEAESANEPNCNIDFFPEGGNLIEGLTSLVAFKATDRNGSPENISGKIVDSSGKQIAELKTVHDGMGNFIIHPVWGNHYSAIIERQRRARIKIDLPPIKKSGIVFHTETVNHNTGDSVYFRISRSIRNKDLYEHLIICAEMQGICDFTYVNFDSATAGNYNNSILTAPSPLSIDRFPPGILHLSVFDGSGEVLAQRLIFLYGSQQISEIELRSSQINFTPHSKNTFVLNIPEEVNGNYSVSVTDADAEKENANDQNIISNIRLTSDIRNYIKDPAWYFQNNNKKFMDLLMLVSSWSRFKWEDIMNNKFPYLKYYAEQSLMLKGRVYQVKNKTGKLLNDAEVPMMIKEHNGSLKNILSVPVDSAGYFTLTNLDFYDTATIYVKNSAETRKKKGQDITVEFEKNPLDTIRFAFIPNYPGTIHTQTGNQSNKSLSGYKTVADTTTNKMQHQPIRKDKTMLDPVVIKAKIKTHTDSTIANYATGVFADPNSWGQTFDFTNDKIAAHNFQTNVLQYIIENVAGIQVFYVNSEAELDGQKQYIDVPLIAWRMINSMLVQGPSMAQKILANAPAFFLDEQQLTGEGGGDYLGAMHLLQSIPLTNVALIRIFQPGTKAIVGGNSPHGIIAIYTINRRESRDYDDANRFNKIKKAGYFKSDIFSPPDYDLKKNLQYADTRKTLYWNPELKADSVSHSVSFSFYNNDVTKRFHIVIEGLNGNGNIVRIDKMVQ